MLLLHLSGSKSKKRNFVLGRDIIEKEKRLFYRHYSKIESGIKE